MIAFTLPGVLQIPAAIIRGTESGGSVKTTIISLLVIAVVCAPYVFFTVLKHEEKTKMAWWKEATDADQSELDGDQD